MKADVTSIKYNRVDVNNEWLIKVITVLNKDVYIVHLNNQYYSFQTVTDVLNFLKANWIEAYNELIHQLTF